MAEGELSYGEVDMHKTNISEKNSEKRRRFLAGGGKPTRRATSTEGVIGK